jgi:hypothetical protein
MLLQHRIVPLSVQLLPSLSHKSLEACVVLVARLTFIPGAAFVQQFVSCNGLHRACVASILGNPSSSDSPSLVSQPGDAVIVEALHLFSNIARASAAHYPALNVRKRKKRYSSLYPCDAVLFCRNATSYRGFVRFCSTRMEMFVLVCARLSATCSGER